MTMWLSVDPMADKYPSISTYNYCMWNPVKLIDPDGMEADEWRFEEQTGQLIKTGNKGGAYHQTVTYVFRDGNTCVSEGDGILICAGARSIGGNRYETYLETSLETGNYSSPYPSLFLTKVDGIRASLNLNPPIQTGSEIRVPTVVSLGAGLYDGLGSKNIANQVAIRGDGTFMYARDKINGFGKGLSWRNGTVVKNTTLGRMAYVTSRRVPALSMVTSGVDIGISVHHNGWDSRMTYGAIGGNVFGIGGSMLVGVLVGGPIGFVAGFAVGILANYGGGLIGEQVYDLTH